MALVWEFLGFFGIFWDFLGGLLVRHVIPRGFAVPQSGMARAKMCRWGMQGFFDGNGGVRGAVV